MNLYLEYFRHLYPLVFFFIPLWLVFKAIQAYRKGERANGNGFIITSLVSSFLLLRTPAGTALLALFIAMPPSEAALIKALHEETGVKLPPNAEVTSYRTNGGFFGYWSGFLKAEVTCQDMEFYKTLSGTVFNSKTPFKVRSEPKSPELNVWQKSRFTIPSGSYAVEYNEDQHKQITYAIDSKKCNLYYHRFTID
jgi:hypothetical protein